jgi:hypothetical protein
MTKKVLFEVRERSADPAFQVVEDENGLIQTHYGATYASEANVRVGVQAQTNPDGVTSLVVAGGNISTLGSIITVGSGGQYGTIQEAIDYIATQAAFTAYTNTLSGAASPITAGTITSWAQGSHIASCGTMPIMEAGSAIGLQNYLFARLGAEAYYYPVESAAVAFGGGSPTLHFSMRRLGTTISSSTPITWWRPVFYKIVLLDAFIYESVAITADMHVVFEGLGHTVWYGQVGASVSVKNGSIYFSNVELYSGSNNIGDVTDNTLRLKYLNSVLRAIGPDGWSPECNVGSVEVQGCLLQHSPNADRGHIFNWNTLGDMAIRNSVWQVNNANASGVGALSSAYLVDRLNCRNIILDGVRAEISDEQGNLGRASFIGDVAQSASPFSGTGANKVFLNDLTMWYRNTFAGDVTDTNCNLSIMTIHSAWSGAVIDINRVSIIAPRVGGGATVSKKLVEKASSPGGACTVNYGKSCEALAGDTDANIAYNSL